MTRFEGNEARVCGNPGVFGMDLADARLPQLESGSLEGFEAGARPVADRGEGAKAARR
jgi:hypothetical protein